MSEWKDERRTFHVTQFSNIQQNQKEHKKMGYVIFALNLTWPHCGSSSNFYRSNQQEAFTPPLDGLLAHHMVKPLPPAFCMSALTISLESMYTKERHCESKVSFPRTQRNDPSQSSNPGHLIQTPTQLSLNKCAIHMH